MRKLMTSLAMWVLWGSVTPLLAALPDQAVYEKDAPVSSSNKPMTPAEQRIYERATFEARERLARIESRHRNGISIQRPAVFSGNLLATDTLSAGPHRFYRAYPFYAWPCP